MSAPADTSNTPVSSSKLISLAKQGKLGATDLVWKEGMPNWVSAQSIPKLAEAIKAASAEPDFSADFDDHPNQTAPSAGSTPSTRAAPETILMTPDKSATRPSAIPQVTMASQSIKEVFGGQAPKYPPVSAFGWYMCCCGGVWSTIVEMQLVGSINKVSGAPAIPVFAVFVPIWQILISYELIKNMNKVISDRSLSVPPLEANHLFIWLLYPVALYQMINHWNAIVDAE